MSGRTSKNVFVIAISFLAAFLLTVLPLPLAVEAWRPLWMVVMVIFWCLLTPNQVGVWVAFGVGVLLDTMLGTLLGQHALLLTVVAYLVYCLRHQLALRPYLQLLLLPLILFAYQLLEMLLEGIYSSWLLVSISAFEWRVVIASMLLWLLLTALLKRSLK